MTSKAESLSKQIINENKSKRFDLGISIAYEEIQTLHNQLKWIKHNKNLYWHLIILVKIKLGASVL